jgi:hypothetical protein
VVVGNPGAPASATRSQRVDPAAAIARAAAMAGGTVQLVARVADDPVGDRLMLDLADAGVGHVAVLRQPPGDAAPVLEAADLDLALRYLTDVTVLVLTDVTDPSIIRVATEATAWSRGALIALVHAGAALPADLPVDATVVEPPASDPEGAFASLVGTLAAALDRGVDPATAFRDTMAHEPAWTPVVD